MLRISNPVSLRISLYLLMIRQRLLDENCSNCKDGCVRNVTAQWKKLFQAWCSKSLKK